jgi:hypothetical protein
MSEENESSVGREITLERRRMLGLCAAAVGAAGATTLAWESTAKASTLDPAIINVKDAPYNAVGDGSTPDTNAFVLALGAIQTKGRGVLFVPPGKYRLTSALVLNDTPVTIEGCGVGVSILCWDGGTGAGLCLNVTVRAPPPGQALATSAG